jgi:hypothetical protein
MAWAETAPGHRAKEAQQSKNPRIRANLYRISPGVKKRASLFFIKQI